MIEGLLKTVEGNPPRCVPSDRVILRVTLWAVFHDRPMSWACRVENWPEASLPSPMPAGSTLSRRWKRSAMTRTAEALHLEGVRRFGPARRCAALDGRPLPVGGFSKDPDARRGRAAGGWGKGYKMHALVDLRHVVLAYVIRPMNEAEQTVARRLIQEAPSSVKKLVGDGHYDSMRLHSAAAATRRKLYTPVRQNRVGRRQQPRRLRLLSLSRESVGLRLLKSRDEIERAFAQASNVGFGFKGLPPWARRERRVFRWMWGKTLLHHAWLLIKNAQAA